MNIKNTSNKELCELYSKHLLSDLPNIATVKDCQEELGKRRLKMTSVYTSVKFEFSDGMQKPIEIHIRDGIIKELWLKDVNYR